MIKPKAVPDWTWLNGYGTEKVWDVFITDSTGRDVVRCHFNYKTQEQATKHAKLIDSAISMEIT